MMKSSILIHNEGAGDGKIDAEALIKVLAAAGVPTRHCSPKDPQLADCLAGAEDLVILAGGDGTVARILSQLPDRADRRIAIVPLGTANNIAQSLGILSSIEPGAGEEILSGWKHAETRFIDIGLAKGPWGEQRFVEGVGIGPLARTIIQFKSEGVSAVDSMRLGREALSRNVAYATSLASPLRIDGAPTAEDLLMAEIMNIQHAGSRVRLAPDADSGDGLFDVVTLATAARDDFRAWLAKGSDKDLPPVTIRRARAVDIEWQGELLRIDDYSPKTMDRSGRVSIGFATQRLAVLVPLAQDASTFERTATCL
ncbi:diacylglycerol kinase family protein [Dongia sp.]|uniref:diacylglycerol/lipid kinase family protein n=1 Tax=Dongia sp. TaxID=1977262 RepID=UPI0035B04DBA